MSFPTKKLALSGEEVSVPHIRTRVLYSEGTQYTLIDEDLLRDKGNVLAYLAGKFYGDPALYYIIQENNPPIHDSFLQEGFVIFLPNLNSN